MIYISSVVGKKKFSKPTQILEYNLSVDTFVEKCDHSSYNYVNEYDLLAGTTIVLKVQTVDKP